MAQTLENFFRSIRVQKRQEDRDRRALLRAAAVYERAGLAHMKAQGWHHTHSIEVERERFHGGNEALGLSDQPWLADAGVRRVFILARELDEVARKRAEKRPNFEPVTRLLMVSCGLENTQKAARCLCESALLRTERVMADRLCLLAWGNLQQICGGGALFIPTVKITKRANDLVKIADTFFQPLDFDPDPETAGAPDADGGNVGGV